MTGIWGHRGFSAVAPENTMASFKAAINCGAEGIETDLQMTSDRKLVLLHDPVLGRTVEGAESLGSLNWDELKRRDCGSWFSSSFSGQRPPLLTDLLDLMEPSSLYLNLEIKYGLTLYPGLEETLFQLLKNHPMRNRILISSFEYKSLIRCREISDSQPLGVLVKELSLRPLKLVRDLHAQSYHPDYRLLLPGQFGYLKKKGVGVNLYTVDKPEDLKRFFIREIDNIITNNPQKALEIRNRMQKK